jgi:hypothetical protein
MFKFYPPLLFPLVLFSPFFLNLYAQDPQDPFKTSKTSETSEISAPLHSLKKTEETASTEQKDAPEKPVSKKFLEKLFFSSCTHRLSETLQSLEYPQSWVPASALPHFHHFIFFQNLENSGFNFCTLAQAETHLASLQREPQKHTKELQSYEIWVSVLRQWVSEEMEHWKLTLPKFLSPLETQKTLEKLALWEQHCRTCVPSLPESARKQCNTRGLFHSHLIPHSPRSKRTLRKH